MIRPLDPGYFISPELRQLGFARIGENCAISRNCTVVGLANITIDDNVRIDGFTSIIASGGPVRIGRHVQIGIGCTLSGRGGITLEDYASLSHGAQILTAVDDFSGRGMTNSTLPPEMLRVTVAPVRIGRFVAIGAGAPVLPGVDIEEGAAVGAMSLVGAPLPGWRIYSGTRFRIRVNALGTRSLWRRVWRAGGGNRACGCRRELFQALRCIASSRMVSRSRAVRKRPRLRHQRQAFSQAAKEESSVTTTTVSGRGEGCGGATHPLGPQGLRRH